MTGRIKWIGAMVAAAVVTACVTINVYFPEAAAEQAADRFIQDVLGEQVPPAPLENDAGSGGWVFSLADLFIASAHAQQANINIDTPQVQAIKQRMAERQRDHLAKWFDAGAIGLASDGTVEIRDRGAVSLSERRDMERLVSEENNDRNAVYREIAVANGHPEWEAEIRQTFARQWIANARSGWYYQNEQGQWVQK